MKTALTLTLLSLMFSPSSFAKDFSKYTITYGSPSWNVSPTKIDSAFLVIRDRNSKKLMQVQLEETAPDSSEFKGHFQFSLTENKAVYPEVYIPPQGLRDQMDEFYPLIQNQRIVRKPIIIKRTKQDNVIDVYDTREQAERAWAAYQESQAAKATAKIPSTPATKEQADVLGDASKLAAKTDANKEEERIRMEQIERQKILSRINEQQKLGEAARLARSKEAHELAEEGMAAYDAKNYLLAEEKFHQSAEKDPANKEFYYKYGVSLYKNGKFNEALVTLQVAEVPDSLQTEKSYFMGLAYFRLDEFKRALDSFQKVQDSKDAVLGPSAAFYRGVIFFNQEKWKNAETAFEYVVDTSKDPKLDERADEYIEAIANAQKLAELRGKRWLLSGTAGLMYDSNVLLAPDLETFQGASQKEGDVRLVTVGDLTYQAVIKEDSTWKINGTANLTNSSKNDLAAADPWLYSLYAPYTHSFKTAKPSQLTINPGYESLFMAVNGDSTKRNILNSFVGEVSYLKANSKLWFSNYAFEYRMDDFSLSSSVGDNDLDANKFTLSTTQTALIGPRKKQALAGTFNVARNQAKGKDKVYNRFGAGVTYGAPAWKDSAWTSSLDYYFLDYAGSSTHRKDNNVTFATALAKPITDWFTWGLMGSFSNNVSTESSSYSYTRYTVMTTATFSTAF
jgi:hypothetical protein